MAKGLDSGKILLLLLLLLLCCVVALLFLVVVCCRCFGTLYTSVAVVTVFVFGVSCSVLHLVLAACCRMLPVWLSMMHVTGVVVVPSIHDMVMVGVVVRTGLGVLVDTLAYPMSVARRVFVSLLLFSSCPV